MFGLFKRKMPRLPSTVAPRVRATLNERGAMPRSEGQAQDTLCSTARVDGMPPSGRFVPSEFDGVTHSALRVRSAPGLPALGIVNVGAGIGRPLFWELASNADPAFVREMPVMVDPSKGKWITGRAIQAAVLPGNLLAVGLAYFSGDSYQTVMLLDRVTHEARNLGDVTYGGAASDTVGGSSSLIDTRFAGVDRTLLMFHTGEMWLRDAHYAREYDHIVVFSPTHPQGLEVLELGIDDGNVAEWRVKDKVLWLTTLDPRLEKPKKRFWSLDLSRVL